MGFLALLGWRDFVIFGLLAVGGWTLYGKHSAEARVKILESEKAANIGAARQSAREANAAAVRIQERIIYREKQSTPIYKYIETYKGDANASDCDNNMSLITSFQF